MPTINGTNAANNLNGTGLADQIFGLGGNDVIVGYDGDDLLEGGKGADQLFGSLGFDTASYRSSAAGVQVNLYTAHADGGDATGDQLFSIESLIGSAYADALVGDDQRNVLSGEGGDDVLLGLGGKDTLEGGGGNDGIDGGDGDDVLRGGDGRDYLSGGAGNDRLDGGAGNGTLNGGLGNDELRGGAGVDTVIFFGQGAFVDLAAGTATQINTQGDPVGIDRLFKIENVTGSEEADLISGDGNANLLTGRMGADVLAGRGGADRFLYTEVADSAANAADTIADFSRAQGDRIDLSAIDANAQASGNEAFRLVGSSAFTGAGQLRYFRENGDTIIEANTTDATAGPEMRIVLEGLVNLQAGDFLL